MLFMATLVSERRRREAGARGVWGQAPPEFFCIFRLQMVHFSVFPKAFGPILYMTLLVVLNNFEKVSH